MFTMYLKLTEKFTISTSLMSEVDHFTLSAYIFGGLIDYKANNTKIFLDEKLKEGDKERKSEEFKAATEEVCRAENLPMINYRFYAEGGKKRQQKEILFIVLMFNVKFISHNLFVIILCHLSIFFQQHLESNQSLLTLGTSVLPLDHVVFHRCVCQYHYLGNLYIILCSV